MKLISQLSLGRGRAVIDFAHANGSTPIDFEPADLIGLVAAYINRGHPTCELRDRLATILGVNIAGDVWRVFETFNDQSGRGLWAQGPATDDIRFTHRNLDAYYPEVNKRRLAISNALALSAQADHVSNRRLEPAQGADMLISA